MQSMRVGGQYVQVFESLINQVAHQKGSLVELQEQCEALSHLPEAAVLSDKASDIARVRKEALEAQPILQSNARMIELEKRWVSLGLPREVLNGPWKCIEVLFSSGIAYQLSAYSKLSPSLSLIRWSEEKQEIELRVNGSFMTWTEFDLAFQWSKQKDAFIGKKDPHKELTLTGTDRGFIEESRYTYKEPFPIAELNREQLQRVREQAASYDDRKDLPYGVLQIYTSPGGFSGPSWLCDAFAETGNVPSHYGVRLIGSDGKVYSFGYMMDPMEDSAWGTPLRLGSTVKSCLAIADYDEWRKFGKRYVTSLPMSQEVFEKTMSYIRERQNRGMNVFNLGRENCAQFTQDVLQTAGYETPDLKVGVGRFFSGLIIAPLKAIPVVSHLFRLVEKICQAVRFCFSSLSSHAPGPIQHVISYLTQPLRWLSEKIMAIVKWNCALLLGGKKISPYVQRTVGDKAQPFLLSWKDMFRYDATDMVSSEALLEWQKKQRSTKEFSYKGPELTVV